LRATARNCERAHAIRPTIRFDARAPNHPPHRQPEDQKFVDPFRPRIDPIVTMPRKPPDLTTRRESFFAYECNSCGNTTWLAAAPERFIYCALCAQPDLTCTHSVTVWLSHRSTIARQKPR
jgi:ribosomal protein S27E